MKPFDSFEKSNAKQWDESSTISYTPSVAELDAPEDDNESLLMDLNDLPSLPQPAPTVQSNTQHALLSRTQNARGESMRTGRAQSHPSRQVAQANVRQLEAAQYDVQPQRPTTSSRGRGRGGSYAQQAHAYRHPQTTSGPLPGSNRTPQSRARAQSHDHHQGSMVNSPGGPRAPSTSTALGQLPYTGYQQNIDRDRKGIGYHSSDENASGSAQLPVSGDPKYAGPGRREGHHNEHLGKFNAFGEWSPKKGHWPKPNGLTTTRRAIDQNMKKQLQNERERFLQDPVEEDRILGYGFYLWPQGDGSVVDVLGADLAPLRHIRMSQKVYIQCVQEEGLAELLKISSESANSETHIAEAIKGIRLVIADAKARAVLATPKYFVVPPTASAMRAFIGPKNVITETAVIDGVEKTKNVMCIGTQIVGQHLSEKEQRLWIQNTLNLDNYIGDFQNRLSSSLMELAPLKYEMRMRLSFGHVVFRKFPPQYAASQQSIDQFSRLLEHPLTRVEIGKTLPAIVVLRMGVKITDLVDIFRPTEGRSLSLKHVDFKHTEIFYVETRRGDDLRVEANIDMRYDDDWTPEYQLGSYNVYRDDHRNKRIELSTIDPERQVDHTLQVITDRPVEIPKTSVKEFEMLVEGSISAKNHRVDSFGLMYPRVHPRTNTELQITKLVMRSVIQYAFQGSGYVVEITLNRTWDGPDTRPDPRIVASVSMFHPQWDLEMESMEHSTKGRKWKRGLSNFFESGFEDFLAAVQTIQELLVVAASEAEEEAAKTQAARREAELKGSEEAALEAERETALEA